MAVDIGAGVGDFPGDVHVSLVNTSSRAHRTMTPVQLSDVKARTYNMFANMGVILESAAHANAERFAKTKAQEAFDNAMRQAGAHV